jgi:phosphopantothenoylcysteine decarboxylase/phosphopantothenate--cysteine ligase
LLAKDGALAGRKVVVTAGATQEDLDPVRYLTNRSSGKQGFALAQAARDQGAQVILISAPTNLESLVGVEQIDVRSAEQMLAAVLAHSADADLLVMAAAVADFRPTQVAEQKIKKTGGGLAQIELTANPDILKSVAEQRTESSGPRRVVGFAAESQNLLKNAQQKLQAKGLDMIVANDISASDAGFAVDTNRVTLLFADGRQEELPLMSKAEVADTVFEKIGALL